MEGAGDVAHTDVTPGLCQRGKWQMAGGSSALQLFPVFPCLLSEPPFLSSPPPPPPHPFSRAQGRF